MTQRSGSVVDSPNMETLRRFHGDWGYIAIVLNALAGLFGLAAWKFKRIPLKWAWVAIGIREVALLIQGAVGVIMVSSHKYTAPRFHMFYGYVAFLTIGLAFSYRQVFRGRTWLLGLLGFFLMGLGIRAILQVVAG